MVTIVMVIVMVKVGVSCTVVRVVWIVQHHCPDYVYKAIITTKPPSVDNYGNDGGDGDGNDGEGGGIPVQWCVLCVWRSTVLLRP